MHRCCTACTCYTNCAHVVDAKGKNSGRGPKAPFPKHTAATAFTRAQESLLCRYCVSIHNIHVCIQAPSLCRHGVSTRAYTHTQRIRVRMRDVYMMYTYTFTSTRRIRNYIRIRKHVDVQPSKSPGTDQPGNHMGMAHLETPRFGRGTSRCCRSVSPTSTARPRSRSPSGGLTVERRHRRPPKGCPLRPSSWTPGRGPLPAGVPRSSPCGRRAARG